MEENIPTRHMPSGRATADGVGQTRYGTPTVDETVILHKTPPVLAFLVVKTGPRVGRVYNLNLETTTIGRDPQNDIILDDEAVSRQHAKIRQEKVKVEGEEPRNQFFVYDLATPNGTKVNGQEVLKHPLIDDDEIELGRTILVFKEVGEERRGKDDR